METLLAFVAEHTIVNSAPIFLGAGVLALVFGRFLENLGLNPPTRASAYVAGGVAGGLVAYANMTIPERPMEFLEGASLAAGMFIYAAIVVGGLMFLRSHFRDRR